jgi:hypothetical protein
MVNFADGGVKLCRFLSIIMGVSSETTLKNPLSKIKYFYDFTEIKKKDNSKFIKEDNYYTPVELERKKSVAGEAQKKYNSLQKIMSLMKTNGANDKVLSYLEEFKNDYDINFN